MKFVQRQIILIEELLRELKGKTESKSHWSTNALPNRVLEAKAILKTTESLVALTKSAKPTRKGC